MAEQSTLNLAETLLAPIPNPNFLPCPQITLTVDPEALDICDICHFTKLSLNAESSPPSKDVALPAMLPCAHIACHACLTQCLQAKPCCPFCRTIFQYALCDHPLQPRLLTRTELRSLPASLPMGGSVPDECPECRIVTNGKVNEEVLEYLVEGFRKLRELYAMASDEFVKARIGERLRTNERHFQVVAKQLSAENVAALRSQW